MLKMNSIRFCTRFSERPDKHYYDNAQIVAKTPSIGDELWFCGVKEVVDAVRPAWMDCEQPSRDVYSYDIYQVDVHDAENQDEHGWRYVAVKNTDAE